MACGITGLFADFKLHIVINFSTVTTHLELYDENKFLCVFHFDMKRIPYLLICNQEHPEMKLLSVCLKINKKSIFVVKSSKGLSFICMK